MADTTKPLSDRDANQVLKGAFNDVDKSLTINGFLVGKIGHKVVLGLSTTTLSNDTETFSFYDGSTLLYQLRLIYTTSTRDVLISAERTA